MEEAAARPSAFKLSTLKNDHPIVQKSKVTLGEVKAVVTRHTAKNSSLGTGTRGLGCGLPGLSACEWGWGATCFL